MVFENNKKNNDCYLNIYYFDFFFHVGFWIYWRRIFPKIDRGQFLVQMELPKDATVEKKPN